MSMIKVIPPGSFNFGDRAAQLIKFAHSSLRGDDLNSLIKRAGHELADAVKKMDFHKGEVPVHLIAMGSTESYSSNRNFDSWPAKMLQNYHPTFVKHAKFYYSHQNKDPKKSYGIIKESYYNEPMQRVELIVALNGTKEAARKNDGLIATEALDVLEKGAELGVSMAAKVPWDQCSCCDNKAKTRADYCTGVNEGGQCKYGGLKHHIGEVFEDGKMLVAHNHHGTFFDISKVFRPADRTAYVLGKVASNQQIGGAELAEVLKVSAPLYLYEDEHSPSILNQIKLARTLASLESAHVSGPYNLALTTYSGLQDIEDFDTQRDGILRALATEKIALSLNDWLKLVTGATEEKVAYIVDEVKHCLPTIFSELIEDSNLPDLLHSNPCKAGPVASSIAKNYAVKYAADCSLSYDIMQKRLWKASLRNSQSPEQIKSASVVSDAAKQLAKQYAIYEIGFLDDMNVYADKQSDLTMDLIIRHNRIQ